MDRMSVDATSLDGRTLFIGIGAQKSGTSWLFANLEQHPEVLMAHVKERHCFDKPSTRVGQGHYLDYFRARIRGERVFGEITPAYATLEASHFVEMLNLHPARWSCPLKYHQADGQNDPEERSQISPGIVGTARRPSH